MDFDIIEHDAALYSLKREQLRALCRDRNLKSAGSNAELIGRLKSYREEELFRRSVEGETSQESFAIVESSEELKELGVEQGRVDDQTPPFHRFFDRAQLDFIPSIAACGSQKRPPSLKDRLVRSLGLATPRAPSSVLLNEPPHPVMPMAQVPASHGDQTDGDGKPTIRLISPRCPTPNVNDIATRQAHASTPQSIRLSPSHLPDAAPGSQKFNTLTEGFNMPPAFVFGSPAAVSEGQFGTVAEKVLREMHRRVACTSTNDGGSSSGSLRNLFKGWKSPESVEVEKKSEQRFQGKHKRQFDK
jgi:hypothetical protein